MSAGTCACCGLDDRTHMLANHVLICERCDGMELWPMWRAFVLERDASWLKKLDA